MSKVKCSRRSCESVFKGDVLSRLILVFCSAFVLVTSQSVGATTIPFGILSFDVLIPEQGQQLGVNTVTIQNLTGTARLPPDFPIATNLALANLTITVNAPSGNLSFALGTLAPGGALNSPFLQFASNIILNSITIAADIGPNQISLDGGVTGTLANNSLVYVLLPASGTFLQAGSDLGVFTVETVATPEPSTSTLLLVACAALFLPFCGRHPQRR